MMYPALAVILTAMTERSTQTTIARPIGRNMALKEAGTSGRPHERKAMSANVYALIAQARANSSSPNSSPLSANVHGTNRMKEPRMFLATFSEKSARAGVESSKAGRALRLFDARQLRESLSGLFSMDDYIAKSDAE